MAPDESRLNVTASIDEATLRPVVRAGVVLGAAVFVLLLIAALPGLDRLLPLASISLATLVSALITLVAAGVLIGAAPRIETVVEDLLSGPAAVVSGVAAVAKHLVSFVAVLVAFRGVAPVARPYLAPLDAVWLYDAAFLLIALAPLSMIGYHLYRHLDPITDLLTRELLTAVGAEATGTETASRNGE